MKTQRSNMTHASFPPAPTSSPPLNTEVHIYSPTTITYLGAISITFNATFTAGRHTYVTAQNCDHQALINFFITAALTEVELCFCSMDHTVDVSYKHNEKCVIIDRVMLF